VSQAAEVVHLCRDKEDSIEVAEIMNQTDMEGTTNQTDMAVKEGDLDKFVMTHSSMSIVVVTAAIGTIIMTETMIVDILEEEDHKAEMSKLTLATICGILNILKQGSLTMLRRMMLLH